MFKKPQNVLIYLISFLLIGCKPIISGVIHDTTCSPPCWKSIIPGKTSREEAGNILKNSSEVKQNSIRTWSMVAADDSIGWEFLPRTGDRFGDILINNDIVFGFSFYPDKNGLSLKTAISYFGEPENIVAINNNSEIPYLSIYLGYPSKGIVLWSSVTPYHMGEAVKISSDTIIEGFWYFETNLYIQLMTSMYIANIDPKILSQSTYPWPGYGDITKFIVKNK